MDVMLDGGIGSLVMSENRIAAIAVLVSIGMMALAVCFRDYGLTYEEKRIRVTQIEVRIAELEKEKIKWLNAIAAYGENNADMAE